MTEQPIVPAGAPGADEAVYRIRVEGRLEARALGDVAGLTLALVAPPARSAVTTLTCALPDEWALTGLINQLHGSGLTLLSVDRL